MVLQEIQKLFRPQKKTNDDLVDRLSHHWTVLILCIFVIVTSTNQFTGDPIHCWCPAQFTDTYVDYANAVCWVKNTYYIHIEDPIPYEHHKRNSEEIKYYQWVPLILAFQAILFKLPNIVWNILHRYSGISLNRVVELTEKISFDSNAKRETSSKNITEYLARWLTKNEQHHHKSNSFLRKATNKLIFWDTYSGYYLMFTFFMIKLLYLANSISQFFLMDAFIGSPFHLLGFNILKSMSERSSINEIPIFPRTTLCDFKIRQLSNIHVWTVQCMLTVNVFNERIFIFVWFLLLVVALFTSYGIVRCVYSEMVNHSKRMFVKHYLKINGQLKNEDDKRMLKHFISDYLRSDGIFILNIVSQNASYIFAGDIIIQLWDRYTKKENKETVVEDNSKDNTTETIDDIELEPAANNYETSSLV